MYPFSVGRLGRMKSKSTPCWYAHTSIVLCCETQCHSYMPKRLWSAIGIPEMVVVRAKTFRRITSHDPKAASSVLVTRKRRMWPRCLDATALVKPATVVQWHRQGIRLFWRWRSRSGRPSVDRPPIPQPCSGGTREPRPPSSVACSSPPAAWSTPPVRHRSALPRSAMLRSPSTWCARRGTPSPPGAASCAIRLKGSPLSTCSWWRQYRFGCST